LIGLSGLLGGIVLVTLTIVTEIKTRHPTRSAVQFAVARNALLEASRRNAEAITAMGMVGRIAKHWHELNRNYVVTSGRASDVGGGLGATVRDLWQKYLVQLNRLTSLQRDEARLDGERGQIIAQAAEAKVKIAETQLQIIQVDQDLASDVAKELRETDSKIGEYVERKVTAEDQLKRTDIRAPQDGILFQ